MSLKSKLLLRFAVNLIFAAAVLFIPAGSLRFWQAWAWMAVTFIPNSFFFLYLFKHDPQLLERRLQAKEQIGAQKLIKAAGILIFFPSVLLPGLDYRFGWSRTFLGPVPLWLTLLSEAVVGGGFLVVFWVMRVNSFQQVPSESSPANR